MPIEDTMAEIGNSDQPLLNTLLTELSSLDTAELNFFKNSWPDIEVRRRRQIMQRLGQLAEDNLELNFDDIFKHGLKDPDDAVRGEAIEGLWENEEPALINPLINMLEQDGSEKVQVAAAMALGKFALLAEHQRIRPSHAARIQEALLKATGDKNRPLEVRRRALEAAAPLSLPEVKQAIMAAYKGHNPKLIVSSIYAMGKNCDPDWLPLLLKELTSTDTEVRYEAAVACGELEDKAAAPSLIKLAADPDVDVRMAALQALGKIGGPEAKEFLESCRQDASEAVRQTAEEALSELKAIEELSSFPLEQA